MNYEPLGIKCGLEIHQQLNTSKLFCSCPSDLRQDEPDFIIKRELRPLAGETGEIDVAAAFEKTKKLKYIYEGYTDTTCLVELDEEPPHQINQEALTISLTIAKMLHCEIPDKLQVMRKTVVDGSNTSGFQRTMLIGMNGWINTKQGKVKIENVSLEEDAARRITEAPGTVTFRLDRLGIAEVEIGTAPEMHTPEQVQEVAKTIGDLLRATGKVKRGLGTIRQDINVSIKGGARCELKLVQDLSLIPAYVGKEAERQKWLIDSGKPVAKEVRNVLDDGTSKFLRPMPGAARMYPETDIPFIETAELLKQVRLPEMPEEKLNRYKQLGLSEDLAKQLTGSDKTILFDELVETSGIAKAIPECAQEHAPAVLDHFEKIEPKFIAGTLLSTAKDVKRKVGEGFEGFSDEQFKEIFALLNSEKIVKDSIPAILLELAHGKRLSEIVSQFAPLSDEELKKKIEDIKKANPGAPDNKITGLAMGQLKGRADAKRIMDLVSKTQK